MLRFADELVLLLIDDKRGDLIPIPEWSLACALAGALLMELALEGRIDTDPDHLSLLDAAPLGDDLLDSVLTEIAQAEAVQHARFWVSHFAGRGEDIRAQTLSRLASHGILEAEEGGFFAFLPSVARTRRYPMDDAAREDVQLRVMRALFSDDIPDPRDVVIIGLADACGAFERLLSASEHAAARARIALLGRMDLIGREVAEVIRQKEALARPDRVAHRGIPVSPRPPLRVILSNNFRDFMVERYLQLGPIFQIDKGWLGALLEAVSFAPTHQSNRGADKVTVMLGPEANRFLAKHDKTHFRTREFWMAFDQQFDAEATNSILSMVGEDHFRMRRLKSPGYACAMGENLIPDIVDVVRREIASWSTDDPIAGTTVGRRLSYNLSCRVMAGISAPEYLDDMSVLLNASLNHALGVSPRWRRNRGRLRRARRRLDELAARIIALHDPEKRGDRPPDVIDAILAMHRADPQFMPETNLNMSVLEPIWFPLDTMGHANAFLLYELLNRPDLLERARAEADALFAQGTPTAQGIHQLDVMKRVLMETLRLHAPVSVTPRTVSNSFEFAGCTVPAGRKIIFSIAIPHHLPEYFPDPKRFDIDRFVPPRNEHRQPYVYTPYGVGTHRCLGDRLAEFLMLTSLATILHDTELVLDPPDYTLGNRQINIYPTRHPDKSFRFRLVRRRSAPSGASTIAVAGN